MEVSADGGEGLCVSGNVPERVCEVAMTEISREQEQVVRNCGSRATPVGHPAGCEAMAEIMQAGCRTVAVAGDTVGEPTENLVHGVLGDRPALTANE